MALDEFILGSSLCTLVTLNALLVCFSAFKLNSLRNAFQFVFFASFLNRTFPLQSGVTLRSYIMTSVSAILLVYQIIFSRLTLA